MFDPSSQVVNSPQLSSSIISEPPDIKNWFSSYTYQSPELDTNELLGNSPQVDEEERELHVEDGEYEEEGNWDDLIRVRKSHQSGLCDQIALSIERKPVEGAENHDHLSPIEVSRYPDSLSLPSEPPDIRNWFSSYVYESPTLDSGDFDISILNDNDFGKIRETTEAKEGSLETSKVKDGLPLCRGTSLKGYARSTRSVGVDNNKSHSAILENDAQEPTPETSNSVSEKTIEIPRVKAEDPLEPILHIEQERSKAKSSNSPAKIAKESVISESDSGWILPNPKSRVSLGKSTEKEKDQKLLTENGFKSLNKKTSPRVHEENHAINLGGTKCSDDSNVNSVPSSCNGNNSTVKREALRDKTNIRDRCTLEVAGKWRCPQKSKPITGPPLKQLRLERWVHRV